MAAMSAAGEPEGGLGAKRGAFNRAVRIAVTENMARAVVEDDFHHFRLVVRHSGGALTSVETESIRYPFSLCPDAGGRLQELVGVALTVRAADVFRRTDPRLQCTHQFDLAALAVAAAARRTGRRYRVLVPDPVEQRTRATVWRDGAQVLSWNLEGYAVAAPLPFSGLELGKGFTDWVTRNLGADEAEAALVLRRAVFVSRGRRMRDELDARQHAPSGGGCWVHQPGRAETAMREIGSWRDFAGHAEDLTASDEDWLLFKDV